MKRSKTGAGRALCTVDVGNVDEIVSSELVLFGEAHSRAQRAFPGWVKLPSLVDAEKYVVIDCSKGALLSETATQVKEAGIDNNEADAIAAWLGVPKRSYIAKTAGLPVPIAQIKSRDARRLYNYLEREFWPQNVEPLTHAQARALPLPRMVTLWNGKLIEAFLARPRSDVLKIGPPGAQITLNLRTIPMQDAGTLLEHALRKADYRAMQHAVDDNFRGGWAEWRTQSKQLKSLQEVSRGEPGRAPDYWAAAFEGHAPPPARQFGVAPPQAIPNVTGHKTLSLSMSSGAGAVGATSGETPRAAPTKKKYTTSTCPSCHATTRHFSGCAFKAHLDQLCKADEYMELTAREKLKRCSELRAQWEAGVKGTPSDAPTKRGSSTLGSRCSTSSSSQGQSAVNLVCSVFSSPNTPGDFRWEVQSNHRPRALYVFNDNAEQHSQSLAGGGNAIVRPWNRHGTPDFPRAAGVCTGAVSGAVQGYQRMGAVTKEQIDKDIGEIRELLATGNYGTLVYSGNSDGTLCTRTFNVGAGVKQYIVEQLRSACKGTHPNGDTEKNVSRDDAHKGGSPVGDVDPNGIETRKRRVGARQKELAGADKGRSRGSNNSQGKSPKGDGSLDSAMDVASGFNMVIRSEVFEEDDLVVCDESLGYEPTANMVSLPRLAAYPCLFSAPLFVCTGGSPGNHAKSFAWRQHPLRAAA